MSRIRTRMGDGYVTELTPQELRDDLVAGSRRRGQTRQGAAARGERGRLAGRPVRRPQPHHGRGSGSRGHPDQGRLGQHALLGAALQRRRAAAQPRAVLPRLRARVLLRHHGDRAPGLLVQAGEADRRPRGRRASSRRSSRRSSRCSTGRCPTSASTPSRTGRSRTPPTCCRAARSRPRARRRWPMAEACKADMLYVSRVMAAVGADGINFDTTASTGDAEFLAVLETVEELAATTDLAIEVGMAAEFVLGFHGQLEYKGTRLAGMWPHQQVKVVEEAGAHLFGPVVNTNSRRVDAVERGPRRHHRQGVLAGRHDPHPRQRGHGRRRRADVRGAAGRRAHARQRGDGHDRPRGRVVGGHRRSLRDVDQPRACLRHGGHPHHWRSGGEDAAPQEDEASGSEEVRGRQAQGRAWTTWPTRR